MINGQHSNDLKLTRKQKMQVIFRRIQLPLQKVIIIVALMLFILAGIFTFFKPLEYIRKTSVINTNKITMNFVGDIMMDRGIEAHNKFYGYESMFSNVINFWNDANFVFANLESAVLKDDKDTYEEVDKSIHLGANYKSIESMINAGINIFACSNNHAYDYGERAITELIDYFEENEIIYSGIGKSTNDIEQYKIFEYNGINVAFISITDVFYKYSIPTDSQGGILTTANSYYNLLTYEASQEADIVIVYIHWGEENQTSANKTQVDLGHQLIDAGANIVIGSHPHVVQEIEKYKDGIIFYSLGNFIFDQGNTYAKDFVMVEYVIDENDNGAFYLYPGHSYNGVPYITANPFYKSRINRELSQGLDAADYYLNEDGFIVIPFNVG